ncbi:hemicentin-2 isoform X4 [Salmo trutta]|uniref:hemicentin-2 isoform X4 n=1 Tax=Salmo trutta TaxID=8032 RepID=UPI0011309564|nr:hemicentin-2-like isoform X4 [Salmo trutta]
MEYPLVWVLILVLLNFTTGVSGQVVVPSMNPLAVGSNVTLNLVPQSPINIGTWSYETTIIVLFYPGGSSVSTSYQGRVSFNRSSSELSISSLQLNDSGRYTVQGMEPVLKAVVTLSVQEPISNVTLRANATDLVELNDTSIFTCSVSSGTSLSYRWLNGSSEVTASDRVWLGGGNSTLTIVSVTRHDEGPFRCEVINGISNGTSQPIGLNVRYGPSNLTMMVVPEMTIGHTAYKTGSDIILSCSAQSKPTESYKWRFNEAFLNEQSPQLSLQNTRENQTGSYACLAYNNVTLRYATLTTMIKIVEPISAVSLNRDGKPPILDQSFTLRCEVTGPVDYIHWLMNGQLISLNNRTFFSTGNKTMVINPIQFSDSGEYLCEAFNAVSNLTSMTYKLVVNFGPERSAMTSPDIAMTGHSVTFNCSASSQPPSQFSWFFNGSQVAAGSAYETGPLTLASHGDYTCVAFNNITGKNSTVSKMLTVVEPVTMAMAKAMGSQPILNQTFSLTCETSGTIYSIHWMMNGWSLYADNRIDFSMNNNTLTFNSVQHSDNGDYQCFASNPVSKMTSPYYKLIVNYGPERPVIMSLDIAMTGYIVIFNCSASSQPLSQFSWFFNGSQVATGSKYETGPLTLASHGNYTCVAFNNITVRNSTVSKMLTVIDPVTMAMVKVMGAQPIADNLFTLTCDTAGTIYSIQWMRNGWSLFADNRTDFSMNDNTLTFNSVQDSDNGDYQCFASNPLSNMTSPYYKLIVNYGPERPVIMSPDIAMTGHIMTFKCSASSQPPSQFSWFFNGSQVAAGSVYETGPLTLDNHGEYNCVTFNNITGRNSTVSKMLTIIVPVTMSTVKVIGAKPIADYMFTLTCETSGTIYSIQWMRNGWPLYAENRTDFSMDNNTLIFNSIQHSDNGDYQCSASNPFSNMTSQYYKLIVNYGPEMPIITGPALGETGQNVTFNCSASSQPVSQFSWFFNGSKVATGSKYETGPLTLASHGNYTCVAFNNITVRNSTVSKMLTVVATVTMTIVKVIGAQPILNERFSLTCGTTGTVYSIQWMRNGWPLYASNGTDFSTNNNTLTFNSVQHSDNGDYQCSASNPFSNMTSPYYKLIVNYGPEMPIITGPALGETGQNVTFNCSASSQPLSQFSWFFNGSQVATGSKYETGPLTLASHGNYTCVAFNNITVRNSTVSKMLTVVATVTMTIVKVIGAQPILNERFSLTCGTTGTVYSIQWMRNGWPLYASSRTDFSTNNNTLTFNSVQHSDNGDYQCSASNPFSNMTSPYYKLIVNYGPEMPIITGPALGETGHNVTFNCSASSQPLSQFSWFFNGSQVATGSKYETGPLTLASHGNYTCVAFSNITVRNSTVSKMLTVVATVTMTIVKVIGAQPILNERFSLTCGTTGTVYSIQWMRNGWPLYASNRTDFSTNNNTLTFNSVQHSDNGDYQCSASNPFSNMTSPYYKLIVNYGPEMPIIIGPALGETGHNVTFNCSASSQPLSQFSWFFNGSQVATGSKYETGPLTLASHGDYTCVAFNNITVRNSTVSKMLTVVATVTMTIVKVIGAQPILNERFSLTCGTTGTVYSIQWMRNGWPLYASNRTDFSTNNNTLTFNSVQHSDNGDYQCSASNPFSNMTSPYYKLIVNYGPEMPIITGPAFGETGHNLTFNCSASSQPLSQFSWFFNGSQVATGSKYETGPLTLASHGNYTCVAFNNITVRNSTVSKMLTVVATVTMTIVKVIGAQPILNERFSLTCGTTGTVYSIQWMRNGWPLYASNRTDISTNNNTLTFNSVQHSDNGDYQCSASNPFSNMTSPYYKLIVNYGPEMPIITGPALGETGHNVTFNCSASSQPLSQFSWFFNGSQVATGSKYETGPLTLASHGNYNCVAFNNITVRNSTVSKMLTVVATVTMTIVKVIGAQPILNERFSLTCGTTGTVYSIHWMRNGWPLYASNRTDFSTNNNTLTFNSVQHSDNGDYQCSASNPFSNMTSQYYKLIVNYGPEMPIITGPAFGETGHNMTFNCSASSQPLSQFSWFFNGSQVATGSKYETGPLTLASHGNYTCVAFNNITVRNSTVSKMLTVVATVTMTIVKVIGAQPILNERFSLTCGTTGTVYSIQWMRNGWPLYASNRTDFSTNNNTLTFNSVQHSDKGDYQCSASNPFSNMTSPYYKLIVNYGPEMPIITGPALGETGQNVTFNCSASSQPLSQFSWFFNGSQVATGSKYETGPLTLASHGNYTCVAFNNITVRNSTVSKMLTVVATVTMTIVKVIGAQPILNERFSLTCGTTGTVYSIQWMRNGWPLYASNRTDFSTNNNTLTFNSVQHSDNGDYQCSASNPFSNMTSPYYKLIVNYGPEMPIITGPALGETGQNVTLNCSASSQPLSQFSWFFNGSQVATGSKYETGPLTLASHGNYTCVAFNNITVRNSTVSKMLTVVATVTMTIVKVIGAQPMLNERFSLTCGTTGTVYSIQWMRNGWPLYASNRTDFSTNNNTLTFNSVQHSDNGDYQCSASNPFSNMTSPYYKLIVNYGPEMPIITGPALGEIGHNVTFNCSASSQPLSQFSWFFNGSQVATGSKYETGPLTLASHGNYTCVAFNNITVRNSTVSKMLTVVATVTMTIVKVIGAQPILNERFSLTCGTTGTVYSIQWMRNGWPLYASNRTDFSTNNNTLTFNSVQHSDNGDYQCSASNPFSNMTSPYYKLIVNYGPEMPIITGPALGEIGHNVTFNCSASSQPLSQFSWFFNGSQVATGSKYETGPLTLASHGNYTCVAFNNITVRNSTVSKMLTVVATVTMTIVKVIGAQPILNERFSLTCGTTGTVYSIQWMRNGWPLYASNRTDFSTNNNTLTFNSVQHSDNGDYQCSASNPFSNMTSPYYKLIVNYGPEMPIITGPALGETGHNVTFNCSASSQPLSQFSWFFNGSQVATGSKYETGPITLASHGNYTCVAFNNITVRNSTVSKMLTVVATVTMTIVKVIGAQPILNERFSLTCGTTGTVYSIQWMRNSWPLYASNRTDFSTNNNTLTFNSVQHSDKGDYQCSASNPFSNMTSPYYKLIVNYGPEMPIITGPALGETGQNVTLNCSASSQPLSQFSWFFNGSHVATGSKYETGPLTLASHGNYTCVAFNNITVRNSTVSNLLTVVATVTMTIVKVIGAQPILNERFFLTCGTTGTVYSIQWMRNGWPLYASNRTDFSMNNNTLTFNSVQHSDKGDYQCSASNPFSNMTSPYYKLIVNYGPEMPIITGPALGETGQNVTLNCSASSQPLSQFSWFFNGSQVATGSKYETGPLTLASHGNYTCVAFNNITVRNSTVSKMLTVVATVTMTIVKVIGAQPILNERFSLTCGTTGTVYSIQWMRNSWPLYASNRTDFSTNNNTLTFNSVQHSDKGDYQCSASNPFSNMTSPYYKLIVNYGPEMPIITGPALGETGQNVTLNCSASSQPLSQFSWFFNGSHVATGSKYETGPLTLASHGNYTCVAFNNITVRNSTVSNLLTVVATVTMTIVKVIGAQPILNERFFLTCGTTGTVYSIQWMRNGWPLYASNRTDFSMNNNTLTFNSVQHSDKGDYQCSASNPFSNMTSPYYKLIVNYGPEMPIITGPALGETGQNVTLNCSASSQPLSQFSWFFNGSQVATGSKYETGPLTLASHGNYTCVAFNNITVRNSTVSKMLTVVATVTMTIVKVIGAQPILNERFSLTCGTTGTFYSIQWMRNGWPLYASNRTDFSTNNNTLTFNSVQHSDKGDYQCSASNPFSNMTSPYYKLIVNYGPEMPIITGPALGETGHNVTFNCSASSQPLSQFSWFFNGSQVATGSKYETGPLTLASHGNYTCVAFNNITVRNSTVSKMLTVVATVTMTIVKVIGAQPILNERFSLTCGTTGTVYSIQWMRNGWPLYASNRTDFSTNNNTLTFNSVQHSDKGDYQCSASNPFSNMTSPYYKLIVNYGPEMPIITGPALGETGHNVTFNCSASSQPLSQFSWFFNGSQVATGSKYETGPLTLASHGNYTCVAFNNITVRNSTVSKMLTVVATVTMTIVKVTGAQPILNERFSLTCGTTGTVYSIQWMRNGWPLYASNRTDFSTNNNTLTFNSVQHSDKGDYQCSASNPFSNMTSPYYKLIVNYGPEMPIITGPALGETGHNVTFNCSASSQPLSQFSWFFNGSQVATGSKYETGPLTLASHGNYTCVAFNNITVRNSTVSKMLTVVATVTMTIVKVTGAQPILNERFSLTCGTTGTVYSIQWMRNGWPLYASNRTDFSTNNNTLTFNSVQHSDKGDYQCSASNPFSNMTSPYYKLIVNYGPEMPIITGPALGETGHNVTFNCSASSQPLSQFSWFFNGSQVGTGSKYETGPLTLASHGNYTCVAFNNITVRNSTVSKMLTVVATVTMTIVKVIGAQPILNERFSLTCGTTGTVYSIQWIRNGSPLYASNRTDFSTNNNTLTFNSVQLSDKGDYQCSASNPFSNMTSPYYKLIVNYGPEMPIITGPALGETGHNVTFNCSASSQPFSQFSWFFNGSQVATGSKYETGPLTLASHGNYTCVAFNNITVRNSTVSKMLTVVATVTMTIVKLTGAQPILNERFSLTCGTTGTVYSIQWMRNGWPLYASNRTDFSTNNNTLTFNSVQHSDNGDYQCSASNPFSNMTSPYYKLIVNYGPEMPIITGPALGETGHNVTFNCSASSQPLSQFSWFFNGSQVATGSKYETGPLTLASHGNYTCVAFNNITVRNSTVSKMLTVVATVTMTIVKVIGAQPILNERFSLTCGTTGTVYSIQWMRNGWPLYASNRTDFSTNNNTLTFNSVQHSDNGDYQCSASNQFSNMTSPYYKLIVNNGPEMPIITGPALGETGHNVTFNCSASSQPLSQFSWFFNGSQVATGSKYETGPLTLASHGNYTCVAFNNITVRNSTVSKILTVVATVTMTIVKVIGAQPILNERFSLTCGTTGTVYSLQWMRNGWPLYASNRTDFSTNNNTLTFNSVQHSDKGDYQCSASNPFSNMTSPYYKLIVNYGPEMPIITGPALGETGHNVTFNCSASSQPLSQFSWFFNGSQVATGSKYETGPLTLASHGNYTCVAFNNITVRNSTVSKMLTVVATVTMTIVKVIGAQPILNERFSLTCGTTGTVYSIQWMRNGWPLYASNRTDFSTNNNTLTFNSVQHSDNGDYQCSASNQFSNMTSPYYKLIVNNGPEMPIITGPALGETGHNVTFNCSASSQPLSQFSWFFNGSQVATGSKYETGPLTLASHGNYTCVAFNNITVRNSTVSKILTVVATVTMTIVNVIGAQPILNERFSLTCGTTGTVYSLQWMRNGWPLYASNRTDFSTNNNTLTFNSVQHSDKGDYQCSASNPFSNMTSPYYKLIVNYGPEMPIITGPALGETGHNVTFNCSASSQPLSQFSWFFNGSQVATGSKYETGPLTLASHGNYTCVAFNNITVRNSTVSKMLTVVATVTMTIVKVIGAQPILNERFSLTCGTTGTVYSIQWMRNGWPLYASNRTDFSTNNNTLTFNSVQHSDKGDYQCSASNPFSNMTSPYYKLIVNYGPEMPIITGPALGETGHNVTFNCSASSQPLSQFSWFFNGSQVATGSKYETGPLTLASHGNYTCVAFNNITVRNSTVSKMLTVVATVTMTIVKVIGAQPILNERFSLTCGTTGTVYSIQWMRNGWPLYASNRTDFSTNNNTLTFNSVQHSDNGDYQCSASNPFSNMTSPYYKLIVNNGPEMPIITGPALGETGHNVTFNCSASSQPLSQFSWFFNGSQVATGSKYETGPLTLASHGNYTCVAFNNITVRNSTVSKMLTVVATVTMTIVKVIGAQPILNERFSLTCGTTGTVYSIQWMRNGWPLYASNRTDFSTNNNTLTFNSVQHSDNGDYQCSASNPFSNMTSPYYKLIVNNGPEMPIITGPALGETGHNVTFNCSASSQPLSQFSWFFNGSQVATGSKYETGPLTLASHGNYTCVAFNNITVRNSTVSKMLTVVATVTMTIVKVIGAQPILNERFSLTCGTTGTVYSIQWMRNGWPLYASNRTDFSTNNNTLTFNSVQHSDKGDYQCSASNPFSNMTSPYYKLIVNYGPEMPIITGPALGETGHNVTFNCSASSQPLSQFSWFFNGSQVATGSKYETGPLTLASHGNYTCVAFNNITVRNSTVSKMLTVVATVTMTIVKVIGAQPILNERFSLTCGTTGTVYSIQWMRNGWPLYASNRTDFSTNNNTLTFNSVQHSDNGDYQCSASNPISNMTSPYYKLIVNNGPEMPIITGPALGETGHNVTFNCSASSQPLSQFSWFFNGSQVATGSKYETGPLTLASHGNYTCVAFNNITVRNSTVSKMLTVVATVTMTIVKVIGAQPILNERFSLTCGTTGTVYSIQWMRNGWPLYASNRTDFSTNNNTLTFNSVQHSDKGDYQCSASNPFSNMTSPYYKLIVNYGPEMPIITGPALGETGHNVTFNCSASSQPLSQFSWFFNGSQVATGSKYETGPLTLASHGNYTCVAFNNITVRNSTVSKMLTVVATVTMTIVKVIGAQPILNERFFLTCGTTGTVYSIQWMRNGWPLYASNRTDFSMNNSTLTFNSVQHSDKGDYQCSASNPFSNMTSPYYKLIVNYGPEMPIITGPALGITGLSVTFNCSASSQPLSQFSWFFNGSQVATGSKYETGPLTLASHGEYTCVAFNKVTVRNSTASKMFTVIGLSSAPPFQSRVGLMLTALIALFLCL